MPKSTAPFLPTTVAVLGLAAGAASTPGRRLLRAAQSLTPPGVRLDLLDNAGGQFDYFRFDKSSGLIASEAPLRLVWRVRTVGALARQSRAMDPLSAFRPVCARVVALSLCSSMKFERSDSSFPVLAYAQDIS